MRVVLIGTGAMSCLFGARLANSAQVTLVGSWTDGIAAIRERGIRIDDARRSGTVRVQAGYLGSSAVPADLAIILVKAWQTEGVAPYLSNYLCPGGVAISLQNGLGNLDLLGTRAFPGATAEGATLLGPGHVRAGGSGPTHVVAPDWVVDLLRTAGFETHGCSPSEAESLVWGKLCVSCGINALTALLGVLNGELLERPDATELMIRAAVECAAVADARGIKLPFPDPAVQVQEVAKRTAGNKSSMLQDMLRGAPTECDAIHGAVAREGRLLGIATPVNDLLWRLVRAAVYKNRSTS
jgi:2-dehydropantoate 2-reductase